MATYAISDIHGYAHTFEAALESVGFSKADRLYVLGDYLNKGLRTKQVYDRIFDWQQQGFEIYGLQGNHEDLALNGRVDRHTLQSFGVQQVQDIPAVYTEYMAHLPRIIHHDKWILVHGGIDFQSSHPFAETRRLLWIRQWQHMIDYDLLGDRYILYGHTPNRRDHMLEQLATIEQNRILCIDNGCFLPHQMGYGQMAVFNLDTFELYFQENID